MLKNSEIGCIPNDWKCEKLLTDGEILSGLTYAPHNIVDNGLLVLRSSNIKKNKLSLQDNVFVNIKQPNKKLIRKDDILICVRNGSRNLIGKSCIIDKDIYATWGAFMSVFRGKNAKYINQYFQSSSMQKQISRNIGATINQITAKDFNSFIIAIPSKEIEIKKIEETLTDVDNYIENLEILIKKKKLIKQGVMQELLTGKKRIPGFNKEWKHVELGSLGKIYNGLTGKTKNDFGWGNSKYVTFLNVLKNRKLNNKLFERVNINDVQNFIKHGDLFFNTSSEIPEEVALCSAFMDETNENVAVNSFCFGFRLNNLKSIYPLYLVDYFRSYEGRKKIIEIAQGSTRYNLSKEYFLKLLIPIPDYEEQKAISTMITDMDEEINLLEQDLEKYKQIKQGMMEQLLTGKIRLVEESNNIQTLSEKKHNQHFDDAVVFANIVASCYDPSYPLGRKKCQKMMYLFKRFNESSVDQFKHYAAGPYDNKARYGGFETIAIKNKYVIENKSAKGSSFEPGPEIEKAKAYCSKYGYNEFIPIFNQYLKYKKVDELELYTTVDKTILELKDQGSPINLNTVKSYISNDKTWVAKLSREVFNDKNIEEAIRFSQLVLGA